jgi:guanylate kinase
VVINDELEAALARIEAISSATRARLAGRVDAAAEAVANRCRRANAELARWKLSQGA